MCAANHPLHPSLTTCTLLLPSSYTESIPYYIIIIIISHDTLFFPPLHMSIANTQKPKLKNKEGPSESPWWIHSRERE